MPDRSKPAMPDGALVPAMSSSKTGIGTSSVFVPEKTPSPSSQKAGAGPAPKVTTAPVPMENAASFWLTLKYVAAFAMTGLSNVDSVKAELASGGTRRRGEGREGAW